VLKYVDADGVRHETTVIDGVTTISGVAPMLVAFDASGTRLPSAFEAQSAIADEEAYAYLMGGFRLGFGEGRGTNWPYPTGSAFSQDEDIGPPNYSYTYRTPGTKEIRLRVRDPLGNEVTITCFAVVAAPPAATHIPVSAGAWPAFVSGRRYTLDAGGDYRVFGTLNTGGRHNIIFEKVGSGANPRIASFSPDGRSKWDAVALSEFRAAHIRTINIDIDHITEGQRGFDFVGIVGGLVRRYSSGGQAYLWQEGTSITRSNVRYARGFFLEGVEMHSTSDGGGFVIFGVFKGFYARNTRFIHTQNGPTTYLMIRIYGAEHVLRNCFWRCDVNGGTSNGTLIGQLALDGETPVEWRDDDLVGPVDGTTNSQKYGYIAAKQVMHHNQAYDAGSFLTNAVASVGGGNPSGSLKVYPRLIGWEDNVFHPSGAIAQTIQNLQLFGQYCYARNNRKAMGSGDYVTTSNNAPNAGVGDHVTYHGPYFIETVNTRPVPTPF
jgi:hypothetical protein